MGEKKQRIKIWMAAALILVALFIDGFQALVNLIPILGQVLAFITSICADVLYIIWFWLLGVGFIRSPKKFAAMGIQAVVGITPVADSFLELTLGVMVIVALTMAEDRGGIVGAAANLTQGNVVGGVKQLRSRRTANQKVNSDFQYKEAA